MALVCLGCDITTSWPVFWASSTNHHHDPVASSAILLPCGNFFKTFSTVTVLFGNRSCDAGLGSLSAANCDTFLCKSTPTIDSMGGLLLDYLAAHYHNRPIGDHPVCEIRLACSLHAPFTASLTERT